MFFLVTRQDAFKPTWLCLFVLVWKLRMKLRFRLNNQRLRFGSAPSGLVLPVCLIKAEQPQDREIYLVALIHQLTVTKYLQLIVGV